MVVPDFDLISEIMMVAEGFTDARLLARKFITLYSLCKELLSKQVGIACELVTLDWRVFFSFRSSGSLRLGPACDQVGAGRGRCTPSIGPRPAGGPSAHASTPRLQHSEDRHGRHAGFHGPDRRSLSGTRRASETVDEERGRWLPFRGLWNLEISISRNWSNRQPLI